MRRVTSAARAAAALAGDFGNFLLALVFYLACWSVGRLAAAVDAASGTRLLDRFADLVERLDGGVHGRAP